MGQTSSNNSTAASQRKRDKFLHCIGLGRDVNPQGTESLGQWVTSIKSRIDSRSAVDGIVIGNEASDADSIVCALTYAYLLSKADTQRHVPLICCDRQDMPLRGETTLLLGQCGVDFKNLAFLDDPGVKDLFNRTECITLVDHNKATGVVAEHGSKVKEILDHHQDLGDHRQVTGGKRRILFEGSAALAGSCTTVVTEKYLERDALGRQLLQNDNGAVARCLLGVILVDTKNLDPAAKKVTPHDTAAATENMLLGNMQTHNELFKALDGAKYDAGLWHSLTIQQVCRYDYKEFTENGKTYGLSSTLCSLQKLAEKAGWSQEVEKRAANVEVFGILCTVREGDKSRRQLLVFSSKPDVMSKAIDFVMKYDSPNLQLKQFPMNSPVGVAVFEQENVGASRKQIAPCIGEFMKSY